MIDIRCISDIRYEDYNEIWAIVRSMKHPNSHIRQVKELSPSSYLFTRYQDIKKAGKWDKKAFDAVYVPGFLQEMHEIPARNRLNELWQKDRDNRKICLVCFCPDESLCHRSIIAGLLQGAGCNVTGVKTDYSRYYQKYKEEKL